MNELLTTPVFRAKGLVSVSLHALTDLQVAVVGHDGGQAILKLFQTFGVLLLRLFNLGCQIHLQLQAATDNTSLV